MEWGQNWNTVCVADLDVHNETYQYANFFGQFFAYYLIMHNSSTDKVKKIKARALHLGSDLRFAGRHAIDVYGAYVFYKTKQKVVFLQNTLA